VGVKNNSVTESEDSIMATASLTVNSVPADAGAELQNYFSNAHTTGGQGFVNITAPFEGNSTASSPVAQEGEICAMIYVFDTDQALRVSDHRRWSADPEHQRQSGAESAGDRATPARRLDPHSGGRDKCHFR